MITCARLGDEEGGDEFLPEQLHGNGDLEILEALVSTPANGKSDSRQQLEL